MKKITKKEVRKIFKDFEIFQNKIYTIDDSNTNFETHCIEYYVWYDMLISFSENKNNNILYLKFEGEIPVVLMEYIDKKYPNNEIQALYPRNKDDIKNCNVILINNIKDLYIFLKESRNYWINIEKIEKELLKLSKDIQIKKLIP